MNSFRNDQRITWLVLGLPIWLWLLFLVALAWISYSAGTKDTSIRDIRADQSAILAQAALPETRTYTSHDRYLKFVHEQERVQETSK